MVENGNSGFYMPVAPAYANGGGFGNGGFGGDWGWIILLLLLAGGGWGLGGMGMGGMMGGMMGMDFGLYPWLNNSQNINDGFRDQMLQDSVTSIRDGVSNLSTQLCNCCGDMQMALANGFAGVEQGANTRQIANMQQAFAAQTAMSQGFNNLQSQFADCCCENRLANCQTQNVIQSEGSATRFADANNTRDIIETANRNGQLILDSYVSLNWMANRIASMILRGSLLLQTFRHHRYHRLLRSSVVSFRPQMRSLMS